MKQQRKQQTEKKYSDGGNVSKQARIRQALKKVPQE